MDVVAFEKNGRKQKTVFPKKGGRFFMGDLDLVFASFLYGYGVLSILRTINCMKGKNIVLFIKIIKGV